MQLDWGSVIVGFFLNIPGAIILATVFYNRLVSYIERRKIVVTERLKQKLLKQYAQTG
jgi:hypothetical protein